MRFYHVTSIALLLISSCTYAHTSHFIFHFDNRSPYVMTVEEVGDTCFKLHTRYKDKVDPHRGSKEFSYWDHKGINCAFSGRHLAFVVTLHNLQNRTVDCSSTLQWHAKGPHWHHWTTNNAHKPHKKCKNISGPDGEALSPDAPKSRNYTIGYVINR